MNKLSRLTALLLALLMLMSSTGLAEVGSAIPFAEFDFNTFNALKTAATAVEDDAGSETLPTDNCGDYDCIVDELAKYETAQARYEYFMGLCKTDSNAAYYYAHYLNSNNHEEADLLCECIDNYYALTEVSSMLPPGDEGHNVNYCPWHPQYGEEPEEEITLDTYTLQTAAESAVYAYIYGELPVGATLTADTVENDFGVQNALTSVKLTVKTAGGNVWQPEIGSYTVVIKSASLPDAGLASVYMTTGEEGAYVTSAYGVTQFTTSGVTLTLGSFGILTFAEYILQETTSDGTTVTVSGNVPAGVKMNVKGLTADEAEQVLPGISEVKAPYFALDITLNQKGKEWQPAVGEQLEVTVSAQVLVDNSGHSFAVYHIHGNETELLGVFDAANGQLTFPIDGFSCVVGIDVSSDAECWQDQLAQMATAEERYQFLLAKKEANSLVYKNSLLHNIKVHFSESLICICNEGTIGGDIYAPWTADHRASCPWHPDNKPVEDPYKATVDGTTVSVSGALPEGSKLYVSGVSEETIKAILPGLFNLDMRTLLMDVTLKTEDGTECQPLGDVTLEISANNLGANGNEVLVYRISGDTVECLGRKEISDGTLSVTMDHFSYLVLVNVDENCASGLNCVYEDFIALEPQVRETELAAMYNSDQYHSEYMAFIGHVLSVHGQGDGVCLCVSYHPDTHGYGSINHTDACDTNFVEFDCSWAFKSLDADEQYDVYKNLADDETKLDYLEELTPEQLENLKAQMTPEEKAELETLFGFALWLTDAKVLEWLETMDVTDEMLQRAYEVHVALSTAAADFAWYEASRLEGTELYDVYTGTVRADYDPDTNALTDRKFGLLVGYLQLTDGTIVAPAYDEMYGDDTTTE